MSIASEIVKVTAVQVTSVETLVATLTAWHPYVDVYVDPNGDALAAGTEWLLYAVDGTSKGALLAQGVMGTDPQRVMAKVPGRGLTIALYAYTKGASTGADLKVALVGWDPRFQTAVVANEGNQGTHNLTNARVTLATLSQWYPLVSAIANVSADLGGVGKSQWEIVANFAGMAPIIVAAGKLTEAQASPQGLGTVEGGCESWTLQAFTNGPNVANAVGTLFGYAPAGHA